MFPRNLYKVLCLLKFFESPFELSSVGGAIYKNMQGLDSNPDHHQEKEKKKFFRKNVCKFFRFVSFFFVTFSEPENYYMIIFLVIILKSERLM